MTRRLEVLHGPDSYINDYLQPERQRARVAKPVRPKKDHGRAGIQLPKPGPGPAIRVRTPKRWATSPKPAPPPSYMLKSRPKRATLGAVPEARVRYSEVYSNAHQKILLRTDHVEKMDAVRKTFNKERVHGGQRSMTTSDLVNACLDFVFEHPIPFETLTSAEEVVGLVRRAVYLSAISRWRQWTETF